MRTPDAEYLNLLLEIQEDGIDKTNRTGIDTRSVPFKHMEFDLTGRQLPLLRTKKVAVNAVVHELIWMLSGDTNIRYLKENGVNIWDQWIDSETAEYVDGKLVAGDLPKIYQHQWRHWTDTRVVEEQELDAYVDGDYFCIGEILDKTTVMRDMTQEEIVTANHRVYGKDTLVVDVIAKEIDKAEVVHEVIRDKVTTLTIEVPDVDFNEEDLPGIIYRYTHLEEPLVEVPRPTRYVIEREIDQIANLIKGLREDPLGRRHIVSAWNVGEIEDMALPPCHMMFQMVARPLSGEERFNLMPTDARNDMVEEYGVSLDDVDEMVEYDNHGVPRHGISCQVYQRSADVPLGVPFNIAFYAMLTHLVASETGMYAEGLKWIGGDVHVYENQWSGVKEQMERTEIESLRPKFRLNRKADNICDVKFDDIWIEGYDSDELLPIKFPIAAV